MNMNYLTWMLTLLLTQKKMFCWITPTHFTQVVTCCNFSWELCSYKEVGWCCSNMSYTSLTIKEQECWEILNESWKGSWWCGGHQEQSIHPHFMCSNHKQLSHTLKTNLALLGFACCIASLAEENFYSYICLSWPRLLAGTYNWGQWFFHGKNWPLSH